MEILQINIQRRRQCDHRGRHQNDVAISQGMPATTRIWKGQEVESFYILWKEHGPDTMQILPQ